MRELNYSWLLSFEFAVARVKGQQTRLLFWFVEALAANPPPSRKARGWLGIAKFSSNPSIVVRRTGIYWRNVQTPAGRGFNVPKELPKRR
jgi:hypothetical protein